MPSLTTDLWEVHADIKQDAAIEAELEEFLGRKEVDDTNDELARMMEVDNDRAIEDIVDKRVNERLKRSSNKDKEKQRKNSSGGPRNQDPTPKKSG